MGDRVVKDELPLSFPGLRPRPDWGEQGLAHCMADETLRCYSARKIRPLELAMNLASCLQGAQKVIQEVESIFSPSTTKMVGWHH